MTPDAAGFNLYLDPGFIDARQCGDLLAELAIAPEAPATLYGQAVTGVVDERARKVARLMPLPETISRVTRRLLEAREAIGAHFGIPLRSCEDPQFLRYRTGDFFVAHQDGNTGMLLSDKEQSRKVSVVIFLSRPSETQEAGAYGGGSLVFSEWRAGRRPGRHPLAAGAGTLVAFASDTTHEVTPVTWGDRYSIASWFG
jgi:SM-20-related protein